MQLTSQNVHAVFMDCLFKEGEDVTNHTIGNGVMTKAGFHPERLAVHMEDIQTMLNDLPTGFYKGTGNGASFLSFVLNKDGQLWTDQHYIADQLLTLGLAIGKVEYKLPREQWGILPGGMPYLMIK